MYDKTDFKRRFSSLTTEELVENSLRDMTSEAAEATAEILFERGIDEEQFATLRLGHLRDQWRSTSATNECDLCGKTTVGRRVEFENQKFCSENCRDESILLARSVALTEEEIAEKALSMRRAPCPRCARHNGDVEIRHTYHVFSMLVASFLTTRAALQCRICGRKESLMALGENVVLGWWSLKGLIRTPWTIGRNIHAIFRKDEPAPSDELLHRARLHLAMRLPPSLEGMRFREDF